jgi:tRNA pseudouridine38-40 synthase
VPQRYKLTLEYDGQPFCGWQTQPGRRSVQGSVQQAIYAFSGETTDVTAAGRTDAGVHALGQVAHLDLKRTRPASEVQSALNYYLRAAACPVVVVACEAVDAAFHARFSAKARLYTYRILNRSAPSALEGGRAWHLHAPLAIESMQQAALHLTGKHDFTSFRARDCQALNPVKTLTRLTVEAHGDDVQIQAEAPSFLHHQVRNMVGTLVCIGQGKRSSSTIPLILAARNREAAAMTAPAAGLYFVKVRYDDIKAAVPQKAD